MVHTVASRLRGKLQRSPRKTGLIENLSGLGYRLNWPQEATGDEVLRQPGSQMSSRAHRRRVATPAGGGVWERGPPMALPSVLSAIAALTLMLLLQSGGGNTAGLNGLAILTEGNDRRRRLF